MEVDSMHTSTPARNDNRPPSTDKDRQYQYRKENQLCLYCGKAGHRVRTCPTRANNNNSNNHRVNAVSTNSAIVDDVSRPIYEEITITLPDGSQQQLTAMIDSGSTCTLISNVVTNIFSIPLVKKSRPLVIHVVDGRRSSSLENEANLSFVVWRFRHLW